MGWTLIGVGVFVLRAGRKAAALATAGHDVLRDVKREFLSASRADGRGGASAQGVRWWMVYHVYGLGTSPLPSRRASEDELDAEEDTLEDFALWVAVMRPSGRQCSADTIKKYVSEVRAFLFRRLRRVYGRGSASSLIPDLLAGYARVVDQPPRLERDGCTPEGLLRGMEALRLPRVWRAALTFGMVALARGCEFALDGGRHERFQESEHMVPADVAFFERGGRRHARVCMRKRKDLRVLRGKQATVYLAGGAGGFFDAVAELELWLAERRASGVPEGCALFCHPDGAALTVAQVRDTVKAVMQAAGFDPARYGAHSLRIGGATAALAAGVPPAQIRLMGR